MFVARDMRAAVQADCLHRRRADNDGLCYNQYIPLGSVQLSENLPLWVPQCLCPVAVGYADEFAVLAGRVVYIAIKAHSAQVAIANNQTTLWKSKLQTEKVEPAVQLLFGVCGRRDRAFVYGE